jgi:hypothetical protein
MPEAGDDRNDPEIIHIGIAPGTRCLCLPDNRARSGLVLHLIA